MIITLLRERKIQTSLALCEKVNAPELNNWLHEQERLSLRLELMAGRSPPGVPCGQ